MLSLRKNASKRASNNQAVLTYLELEKRQVLAAIFPTYIDGTFTLGNGEGSATPYDLGDTFKLESNPTATKTIYLDFDGHHSVNNRWGHDIVFPAFDRNGNPSSFSTSELIEIQLQFQNVAEDFLPFDVNVTTKDPGVEALRKTSAGDQFYGVRAINTQATDGFGSGIGGVAYLFSFNDNEDNPVFTFNKGENNGAMTNSHEVGHALGLRHDGLGGSTYHPGTGTGETSWGPLMGAPFGENVTQWSNGDYSNSTNTEDDYTIITQTGGNGFGFRADDNGDTIATASVLPQDSSGEIFEWGIIEQNDDTDVFRFETGGLVDISIKAFGERPNLDIRATIYNSSGAVVATNNPVNSVDASFNLTLPEGEYYLEVDGVGKAGVYSDYGSIGFFSIEGTIENALLGDVIGETGKLNAVDERWVTVTLNHTYVDPVVIAGTSSRLGGSPGNVRVRNVTSNSFEMQFDHWEYLPENHRLEMIDYLVVEAGEYTLSDGSVLVAGNNHTQRHIWQTYDLGSTFLANGADPVVLSQIVTTNDPISATTRIRYVDQTGFDLRIKEEEAQHQGHGVETVAYVAIQQAIGTTGDLTFEVDVTPQVVRHIDYNLSFTTSFAETPAFFSRMQTQQGGETAVMRYKTLDGNGATIFVQEEKSLDNEVKHAVEVVGYLAIEAGDLIGSPAGGVQDSPIDDDIGGGKGGLFGFAANFDGLTEEDLWDARREMESWGQTEFPLGHEHCDGHEHDSDHVHEHDHDDHCNCDHCAGSRSETEHLNASILAAIGSNEGPVNDASGDEQLSHAAAQTSLELVGASFVTTPDEVDKVRDSVIREDSDSTSLYDKLFEIDNASF